MRSITLSGETYTLDDEDGTWSGPDSNIVEVLDAFTELQLSEMGPADGDPFYQVVHLTAEIMKADEVANYVTPSDPDAVY